MHGGKGHWALQFENCDLSAGPARRPLPGDPMGMARAAVGAGIAAISRTGWHGWPSVGSRGVLVGPREYQDLPRCAYMRGCVNMLKMLK